MTSEDRGLLVRATHRVTEQAANADAIVDEAMAAGLDGSDRIVVSTKMLRSELLSVKADLERELAKVILDAPSAGRVSTTSAASVCGPDIGRTRSVTARDAEAHALTLANRPGGGWAS